MDIDEVNKALRLIQETYSYQEIIAEPLRLSKEAKKRRFNRLTKIKKRHRIRKDMRGELF